MRKTVGIPFVIVMFIAVFVIYVPAQDIRFGNVTADAQEDTAARAAPPRIPGLQEPVKLPATPTLADGTAILLLLTRDVKVKEVSAGDVVPFVLARDFSYRDVLLAPKDSPVEVIVQTAEKAKWLSRGSKLGFDIQGLRLLNGSTLPLRGVLHYKGGINPVADTLLSGGGQGGGNNPAAPVLLTGAMFALLAPGSTENATANSLVYASVDGDFVFDLNSFRPFQPTLDPALTTGRIQVVRGVVDRFKGLDFYCNGIPIAHLGANRKYVADLKPGWYRFSSHPQKPALQIYVQPGGVYTMLPEVQFRFGLTMTGKLELASEGFSSGATVGFKFGPGLVSRSVEQVLDKAKPVEKRDLYGDIGQCAPLVEVFASETPPGNGAASSTGSLPSKHPD